MWGRRSCLPVGAAFQPPQRRTGRSGELAGWKACPTLFVAVLPVLSFRVRVECLWQALQ